MATAAPFELRLSLPCDERFRSTLEALVVFAARTSGCTQSAAERFGTAVAVVACQFRSAHPSDVHIPVVLRRRVGTLEVTVGDRTMTPQP